MQCILVECKVESGNAPILRYSQCYEWVFRNKEDVIVCSIFGGSPPTTGFVAVQQERWLRVLSPYKAVIRLRYLHVGFPYALHRTGPLFTGCVTPIRVRSSVPAQRQRCAVLRYRYGDSSTYDKGEIILEVGVITNP